MHASLSALVLLGCFTFGSYAELPTDTVASLPPCAVSKPEQTLDEADLEAQLSCLATAVLGSPCQLTDISCICADTSLKQTVEICVLASCTMKESLGTCVNSKHDTLSLLAESRKILLQQLVELSCATRVIRPVCRILHCLSSLRQSASHDSDTTQSVLRSDGDMMITVGVLAKDHTFSN